MGEVLGDIFIREVGSLENSHLQFSLLGLMTQFLLPCFQSFPTLTKSLPVTFFFLQATILCLLACHKNYTSLYFFSSSPDALSFVLFYFSSAFDILDYFYSL